MKSSSGQTMEEQVDAYGRARDSEKAILLNGLLKNIVDYTKENGDYIEFKPAIVEEFKDDHRKFTFSYVMVDKKQLSVGLDGYSRTIRVGEPNVYPILYSLWRGIKRTQKRNIRLREKGVERDEVEQKAQQVVIEKVDATPREVKKRQEAKVKKTRNSKGIKSKGNDRNNEVTLKKVKKVRESPLKAKGDKKAKESLGAKTKLNKEQRAKQLLQDKLDQKLAEAKKRLPL
jgi:hypothetical protein